MTSASFITIAETDIETLDRAEGASVVATARGETDRDIDAEVYAAHGIVSRPCKKTRAIRLRLGRLSIIIAAYTYGIGPPANPGATKLYSTDANGIEKGSHLIDSDGKHKINTGTKEAARKNDAIQSTATDDPTFWTWVTTVSAVLNGLVPGSVPVVPSSVSGKITQGTSEVLLP